MTEPVVKAPETPPARSAQSSFGARFLQELTSTSLVLVTVLAILTALVVGAVLIVFSDESVLSTWSYLFAAPGDALSASWDAITAAYGALFSGAFGGSGPLSETIVAATPLMLAGLGVALGFRAGLFNIGAEGQLRAGGLLAGLAGLSLRGLPAVIHLPLALLAGVAGGALCGLASALYRRPGRIDPISQLVALPARLPRLAGQGLRLHAGIIVALLAP